VFITYFCTYECYNVIIDLLVQAVSVARQLMTDFGYFAFLICIVSYVSVWLVVCLALQGIASQSKIPSKKKPFFCSHRIIMFGFGFGFHSGGDFI